MPPAQDVIGDLNRRHGVDLAKVIRAVVRRHKGLFHHFRDRDEDDLCQDMLLEVLKALPNYNPRFRFDKYVCTVVNRKLINWSRNCSVRARYDAAYARTEKDLIITAAAPARPDETRVVVNGQEDFVDEEFVDEFCGAESFEGEIVGGEGEPPLVEWFGEVFRHARRITAKAGRERRTYEPAQQLAVAALARKLKTSVRGTRGQFEDREDLRRVVGFSTIPSRMWFCRALNVPMGSN